MALACKKKWLSINMGGDLCAILTGRMRLNIPKDAEIQFASSGDRYNMADFLMVSDEFDPLQPGMVIPGEQVEVEPIVSLSYEHAHALTHMIETFLEIIKKNPQPPASGRSDELTSAYCEELKEVLAT